MVTYAGATGVTDSFVSTSINTFYSLTSAGVLTQRNVPLTNVQKRSEIYLGFTAHPVAGTIQTAQVEPSISINEMAQTREYCNAIGFVNESIKVSPNGANLNLNLSSGFVHKLGVGYANNPIDPSVAPVGPGVGTGWAWQYRTQTGVATANTSVLDVAYYDNAGTRTAISGTKFCTHRFYAAPSGLIRAQLGQVTYSTMAAALAGLPSESYVTYSAFATNFVLIGMLTVASNATALNVTTECMFSPVSKFGELAGGGSGGTSTTTLQQAYNNSVTPEITTANGQGALSLKRGTAADTDDVLDIQNGAGAITAKITGAGEISGNGATLAGLTASQIVATDANKKLQTLAVATYPSLTELSRVKGVTSAIQTQLNAKGSGTVTSVTGTAPVSVATGTTTPVISMAAATDSVPGYLTAADHTTFAAKQASLTLTTTGTSGAATLVGATLNIPQYAGGSSGGGSSFTKEYYYATTAGTSLSDYYAMKMKSLDASPSWDTSGWSAGLSGFKGKVMLPFAATSFNISFRLRLYNATGTTWNAGSTVGMRVAFVPLNYYNSGTPVASATMNYTIVNQVPTGYAVNDVDASFQAFTAQSISLTAGQIYGVSLYSTGSGVQTALGECAMSIEYKGA
jgi:hypothetical protein